ncbi:hypothetical protein [Flavobacterium aquatile]|uniref:Uncharacterized protein n=1 Tax=Flavobacterium aquatile LMG 4008 = ATCC 11947 TaxID=1453498 RepID=A0A095ST58_9FLAO|nr:hypothetical protein [Flavobacterium aquatile]KGD67841.1 hypothetical protein LG45_12050 [Flavobacterium aquatile LMG 4008 = ATCC 11947]OXA67703.1 hypothetical protein B0A61_07780 [Flavobacterium aquatile LMG 4008 = ATCC 11947]GEC78341.1 hypothetical protein FAQ01_12110 [Flavobacterium aquatile]
MKIFFLFFTLFCSSYFYAQSGVDQIIADLNNNLRMYNANPQLTKVFINRNENILDILNYQIPLEDVKVYYEVDERIFNGVKIVGNVSFKCEDSCIKENDYDFIKGVAFAFKSKDGAYKFIDLIYKLKKLLLIE